VLVVHVGQFKTKKFSPLSLDIEGMPVHALVVGLLISTLVTLSKHSLITVDPWAKFVLVIVRVPVACVITKERVPSLSVDDCVITLTQSVFAFVGDLVGLLVGGAVHASEEDDPCGLEKPITKRRTAEQKVMKKRHSQTSMLVPAKTTTVQDKDQSQDQV
jgi:hypothetical protein